MCGRTGTRAPCVPPCAGERPLTDPDRWGQDTCEQGCLVTSLRRLVEICTGTEATIARQPATKLGRVNRWTWKGNWLSISIPEQAVTNCCRTATLCSCSSRTLLSFGRCSELQRWALSSMFCFRRFAVAHTIAFHMQRHTVLRIDQSPGPLALKFTTGVLTIHSL